MGKFTVLASFTDGCGYLDRVEKFEAESIYDAFREFGRQAARSNGVIVIDEHDGVWAEQRPTQIEKMTYQQRAFYRHWGEPESSAA